MKGGVRAGLVAGVVVAAGFAEEEGRRPGALSALRAPSVGKTVVDPGFGGTIRRLTDDGEQGGIATVEYPQLQAINADETKILVNFGASFGVMDLGSGRRTHVHLPLSLPRWHPQEADVLVGFDRRKEGPISYRRLTLEPGGTWTVDDGVRLSAWGFTEIDKGAWEDLSSDGRYLPLLGMKHGVMTAAVLHIPERRLVLEMNVDNVDWVAVSPSGRYFVVQYVKRGLTRDAGLVVYQNPGGEFVGHASDLYTHGDLGFDADGHEVFVTIDYDERAEPPQEASRLSVTRLAGGIEGGQRRFLRTFRPAAGFYTSCRSHRRPGFCLHSDDLGRPGQGAFLGELWLGRLSDGQVVRLAHHRSSGQSYYTLVRPTLSPSGRFALFSSDWARPNAADQTDLYLIDLAGYLNELVAGAPRAKPTAFSGGCACHRPPR